MIKSLTLFTLIIFYGCNDSKVESLKKDINKNTDQIKDLKDDISNLNHTIQAQKMSEKLIKSEQSKIGEITERQDNKWVYLGYKADSLSKELIEHIRVYKNKADSLNEVLSAIKFDMIRMDDKFTQKDEKLELDISELSDEFSAYKRKANRDFRSVKKDIKTIREDLQEITKFLERIKEKSLYTEEELQELKEENNQ